VAKMQFLNVETRGTNIYHYSTGHYDSSSFCLDVATPRIQRTH